MIDKVRLVLNKCLVIFEGKKILVENDLDNCDKCYIFWDLGNCCYLE